MTGGIHAASLATLPLLFFFALFPVASAAFTDTFVHEDGPVLDVDAADTSITSAESVRHFSIDNPSPVPVYVTLTGNEGEATYLSEAGYVVDVYLSTDDGASWTQVAQGVQSTDPSQSVEMSSADAPAVRFVLHFPAERTARVVDVAFLVALDESSSGTGNGGIQNPSFRHSMDLYFYGAASDLDNDGLPDAWEYEHFGDLKQGPEGDPDGDGVTNQEEYTAGTNPTGTSGGPGGGGVYTPPSDGLVFVTILAQVLLAFAAGLGIVLARRRMGRGFTDNRVLRVWGPSALLFLGAFVALWLLEITPATGPGWAAWHYPALSVGESVWATTGLLVVLVFGVLAVSRQPQNQQAHAGARVLGAVAVVAAASLLVFGLLDVPGPATLL